jgi:predicted metal-dependent hydrolase
MDTHLRAGVAIYNAGYYHAAHDAWEDHWLDLESGTDEELLLHGLIQFTAAVYHARNRNWSGATGLAESAEMYLADLPPAYRDVNVETVREYLAALERDPERTERGTAPSLTHGERALTLEDLDFAETAVAAQVLAEEFGYDEGSIEAAVEYARADLDAGEEGSRFVTLLFDFVRDERNRAVAAQRLAEHVQRRASRNADVEGLFET